MIVSINTEKSQLCEMIHQVDIEYTRDNNRFGFNLHYSLDK